jgi:hypothetical protein
LIDRVDWVNHLCQSVFCCRISQLSERPPIQVVADQVDQCGEPVICFPASLFLGFSLSRQRPVRTRPSRRCMIDFADVAPLLIGIAKRDKLYPIGPNLPADSE